MKSEPQIISTQLAIFLDSFIKRPDLFFNKLNSDLGGLIDAMPQVLPLPPEAPAEIPRVMAASSYNKNTVNISLNRVDFIRQYNPAEDIEQSIKEFKALCKNFILSIISEYKISRFGNVGSFYVKSNNPEKEISDLFINKDAGSFDEISLRLNKTTIDKGITFNNVISINQGHIEAPNYNGNGIVIQLDNNSIARAEALKEEELLSLFEIKSNAFNPTYAKEVGKK